MRKCDGWRGTAAETDYIIKWVLIPHLMKEYDDLTEKEALALLQRSLVSNIIIDEIKTQTAFLYEEYITPAQSVKGD